MIRSRPTELTLTLAPQRRFEAIDVNRRIAEEAGDILRRHRRALYASFHTTAGYLDQSLSVRLHHRHDLVSQFFRAFHALFPQGGEYRHDQMHLRSELTDEQKVVEPRNGDSHLTFIGAGMRNCVTYRSRPDAPVYFIELDGKTDAMQRQRKTTVVAYDHDEIVARTSITIPMSKHPIDSVNLADPRLGLLERVNEILARAGVERARVDLVVDPSERNVGLTVNEYETLLMQNDLVDVLRDPLRFAKIKGRNMMNDPLSIPGKTLNYAKYRRGAGAQFADGSAAARPGLVRAVDGEGHVAAGAAVPALTARQLSGGIESRDQCAGVAARHLPEPDSRPVATCGKAGAPPRHRDRPVLVSRG